MSRRRIVTLAAAFALASACAAPTAAPAESVIIGSSLQEPWEFSTASGQLGVQTVLSGSPPHPLDSPVNGRITSWAVRSGHTGAHYSLRVLSLVGGSTYLASGTVPAPAAVPAGGDAIHTYPASVLIGEGETIGLQNAVGASALPINFLASANDTMNSGPPISDGSTGALSNTNPVELLVHATVEFCRVPKVKGKTRKKAKNRLRAADCGVKVKKKEAPDNKRGEVLRQKQKPGSTVPPGTKVVIFVGEKGPEGRLRAQRDRANR